MKSAQKMKMRASMQGGGLQQVLQFFLSPETMGLMADQQGKTVDMESISELVCDVNNLNPFAFYRPMTPPEVQAKDNRAKQQGMEKMDLQQARMQQMSADAHERDETSIVVALLGALAKAGLLNMALGQPTEIGLKAKELDAAIEGGQFDAAPAAPSAGA